MIELNGAIDLDDRYWLEGTNVYEAIGMYSSLRLDPDVSTKRSTPEPVE